MLVRITDASKVNPIIIQSSLSLNDNRKFLPVNWLNDGKASFTIRMVTKREMKLTMNDSTTNCRNNSPLPAPFIFESRSEEHTSELQSQSNLVCRFLLEKK